MTLEEGHKLALKTLKQVMEEKLDENNVQLAQVSHSSVFHIFLEVAVSCFPRKVDRADGIGDGQGRIRNLG